MPGVIRRANASKSSNLDLFTRCFTRVTKWRIALRSCGLSRSQDHATPSVTGPTVPVSSCSFLDEPIALLYTWTAATSKRLANPAGFERLHSELLRTPQGYRRCHLTGPIGERRSAGHCSAFVQPGTRVQRTPRALASGSRSCHRTVSCSSSLVDAETPRTVEPPPLCHHPRMLARVSAIYRYRSMLSILALPKERHAGGPSLGYMPVDCAEVQGSI